VRTKAILLMFVLCIGVLPLADIVVDEPSHIQDEETKSVSGRSSTIATNWTVTPTNGFTDGGTELTITGSGFLDMAFKNVTSDGEVYEWTTSPASYVTSSGWDPSIGVNSTGTVHIVHSNLNSDDFWHSTYDGSTWKHDKIRDCDVCSNADLVIDSNDNIHIAYYHSISGTGYLLYSMYDGTSWTNNWSKSNVESDQIALAIDANNQPHISYSREGYMCNAAMLSYYGGSSWTTVTLDDTSTYIGCDSSIAIDSNGFVHVAYRHQGNMDLLIASNISGSWQRYTVDNGNGVGYHSAMDVDSNDVLHIVYKTNAAGNTVKYATGLSGSAWTDSNQGTSRSTFSMSIDQFDNVHISEYNGNSDLGYSMMAPGGSLLQSMTVDNVGDVGYESDIFVDDNNMVHIAYYDTTNKLLKYANRSTGMFMSQEITVQFGQYGNVTGTVVNDTVIRVTTPMAGLTADTVNITLRDKDDNEHILVSAFMFISADDLDSDGVLNANDDCPNIAGSSTQDANGCPDTDGDGYSDSGDIFPTDSSQWNDTDGDGYGDAYNGNDSDIFPLDASQWNDTDGDGYGDNPEGNDPDSCPEEIGNSTYPGLGCLDSDGDGFADTLDAFPFDQFEHLDSDQDGVGDNSDEFPIDANETMDSDGDGVGDNADAFPNDANETIDSDGDGLGDNSDPNPLTHNFIDSDGDNVPNIDDDFPADNTQWSDLDEDGFGDNPDGNDSDDFPLDPSQWKDSDGDGYGDNWANESWNTTRSPTLPGIFVEGASFADYCPETNGNSTADGYYGCLDDDGNGIANMFEPIVENNATDTGNDATNDDETSEETEESDSYLESLLSGDSGTVTQTVGFGAILLALLALLQTNAVAAILPDAFRWVQVLRKNSKLSKEEENELSYLQSVVQAYFADHQSLIEELRNMKADLTARYTNNQIKKETREKLFTIIDDLMTTNPDELEHIAHNDIYFGLAETLDTKQRAALLKEKVTMEQSGVELFEQNEMVTETVPSSDIIGTVSTDGYEYLEQPPNSGIWFIRNSDSGSWERWSQ
jgi:DNA-directed RNA polymerase subunit F